MTVPSKTAAPLGAAIAVILAVSGCHAGPAASGSSRPSPAASAPTDQTTTGAGSGATPAAGGNKHACSVVTEPEASMALGGADLGPGQETATSPAGVGGCVYGGVVGAGVRVTVDTSGVGKAVYEGDRASYPARQ